MTQLIIFHLKHLEGHFYYPKPIKVYFLKKGTIIINAVMFSQFQYFLNLQHHYDKKTLEKIIGITKQK